MIKGKKQMNREIKNNNVTLCGEIVSNFEFSHKCYGDGFYTTMLASERKNGQKDIVPIMVSGRLVDTGSDWTGRFVKVFGQFRSYNKHEGEKNRLILSVFVRGFEDVTEEKEFGLEDENLISLDGHICKPPIYRKTTLGREISDILLAVNRNYEKSDYIPCIAWRRNARFSSSLKVSTRLQIDGRIQSREYQKRISDDEFETRTAYEVSVGKLAVIEETEKNNEQ